MPELADRNTSNRSLILDKHNSAESSEDEKDGTIKLSRFSSKMSNKKSLSCIIFYLCQSQIVMNIIM